MIWKAFMTYRKGVEVWTDVWIIEADNEDNAKAQISLIPNKPMGYHQATSLYIMNLATPAWVGEL